MKLDIARFVERLGLLATILHEQPNKGATIIEKLERHADAGFAIVLLSPDDMGRARAGKKDRPRARQNVILEMGMFIGLLGRSRVCVLHRGEVELPSDIHGVIYIPYADNISSVATELMREMKAAHLEFDANDAL